MIVLVALPLLLLLTPLWTHFAIDTSGGGIMLATPDLAHEISDKTVNEMIFGPGTFSYSQPPGPYVFTPDEAAHLRDARALLIGFLGVALVSAILIAFALATHGRDAETWRSIARGAVLLVAVLVVLGAVGALAFGFAFELFHRILFPGGNWAFPPDSQLIGLYPFAFWQLSAAALGALALAGAALVWVLARRRALTLERGS